MSFGFKSGKISLPCARSVLPPSSSGQGHLVLIQKIGGSIPPGGTARQVGRPDRSIFMRLLPFLKVSLIFGLTYIIIGGLVFVISPKSSPVNLYWGLLGWLALQPTNMFLELGIPLPLFILGIPYAIVFNRGILSFPNDNLFFYVNNIIFYFILGFVINSIRTAFRLNKSRV